jgi:hypothetical protein
MLNRLQLLLQGRQLRQHGRCGRVPSAHRHDAEPGTHYILSDMRCNNLSYEIQYLATKQIFGYVHRCLLSFARPSACLPLSMSLARWSMGPTRFCFSGVSAPLPGTTRIIATGSPLPEPDATLEGIQKNDHDHFNVYSMFKFILCLLNKILGSSPMKTPPLAV